MKKIFLLAVMAMMAIAVQADDDEFVVTSGAFKVVNHLFLYNDIYVVRSEVADLHVLDVLAETVLVIGTHDGRAVLIAH